MTKSRPLAYEFRLVEIDGRAIPGAAGVRETLSVNLCGVEEAELDLSAELFVVFLDLLPVSPAAPQADVQLVSAAALAPGSSEWKDGFAYREKWPPPPVQWLALPQPLRPKLHLRFAVGRMCATPGGECAVRLSFRCPDGNPTEISIRGVATRWAATKGGRP